MTPRSRPGPTEGGEELAALARRERARGPIATVTRTPAWLGGGVVVDADGFLVDRYRV